jgi:hypothetical protein
VSFASKYALDLGSNLFESGRAYNVTNMFADDFIRFESKSLGVG